MTLSVLQCFCRLGDYLFPVFAGVLAAVTSLWLNGDQTGTRRVNKEKRFSNVNRLAQYSPSLGTQQ